MESSLAFARPLCYGPLHAGIRSSNFIFSSSSPKPETPINLRTHHVHVCDKHITKPMHRRLAIRSMSMFDNDADDEHEDEDEHQYKKDEMKMESKRKDRIGYDVNTDIDENDMNALFDEDTLLELLALNDELGQNSEEPDFGDLEELEKILEQDISDRWGDDEIDDEEALDMMDDGDDQDDDDDDDEDTNIISSKGSDVEDKATVSEISSPSALEKALLQGVVPASAGVGSNCLPGDYNFDPLGLATKNYFNNVQSFLINLLPAPNDNARQNNEGGAALPVLADLEERPPALILRDYRESEIRHGRLAMLAALLWPLQEITDRLFIPASFGSTTMIYGGVTLPFVTLFMTFVMLLLGYLDIYAASIKDQDAGDAFLPGECFWDPLSILDGAPDDMKRNMQARELNNGRFAMIAVLSYILQEGISHQPLISLPWNQILFEPAFEIPAVQAWLDGQFAGASNADAGIIDEIWNEIVDANDVSSNPSLL